MKFHDTKKQGVFVHFYVCFLHNCNTLDTYNR